MFKSNSRGKTLLLTWLILLSFVLMPLRFVVAGAPVSVVTDAPATAKEIKDTIWDKILKALKTSVLSAGLNVAMFTTQKLAYDAAMWLSSGGEGQKPLFETMSFKEYTDSLWQQATGEFIGSLAQPWSSLGLNICEPSPLQKLEFQKSFVATLPLPKAGTNVAPAPKCDWDKIKTSYVALYESAKDFEVDMDVDFSVEYEQGSQSLQESLATLATGTHQGVAELSKQVNALSEKLYGQGIDLTKLWTDTGYMKKLLDPTVKATSELQKKVPESKLVAELLEYVSNIEDERRLYDRISSLYSPKQFISLPDLTQQEKQDILSATLNDQAFPANLRTAIDKDNLDDTERVNLILTQYKLNFQSYQIIKLRDEKFLEKILKTISTSTLYAILGEYAKELGVESYYASLSDDEVSALKNTVIKTRRMVYEALNKKIVNLEKSLNGERKDDKTLKNTLLDPSGDLYFWQKLKRDYAQASGDVAKDAVLANYLMNEGNLSKLLRQQIWDRLLIMQLVAEKQLDNKLIKYIYYDDINKYVKGSSDPLSSFVSFIQPGNNPASIATSLEQSMAGVTGKYAQKLEEFSNNKGFKAVTDIVSGRVKTPADVVAEQFKQTTIKDPSATKQTSMLAAYVNADVGFALLHVAVSTFTNTVFNNMITKVYEGLFKPDEIIDSQGVMAGLTQSQIAKKLSANINIEMAKVDTSISNYNVLDEFAICVNDQDFYNDCVLDEGFVKALQTSPSMTIAEATESGFLNEDWYLLPQSHPLNAEKDCYTKAFCYQNLQKLRHARIISVGWELVADLCEDPNNVEFCTTLRGGLLTQTPFTLKEALDNFYNCGQDANHPYNILCNLIDPNWLLTLPQQKCQTEAYGNQLLAGAAERDKVCVDDVSCVNKDSYGNCQDWGYCTKEKNTWRFAAAQSCSPQADSCRSFVDSKGKGFSFLKNTLLLDSFNTCDSENIGCTWYSKNRIFDSISKNWLWQDRENTATNEKTDRIYLTGQTETCTSVDEGCNLFVRAMPRLGTNLLPNSDFKNFVNKGSDEYFESWKVSVGDQIEQHEKGALLTVQSGIGGGVSLFNPINIVASQKARYFIYSATVLIPSNVIGLEPVYNWDVSWGLKVDAYKTGNANPRADYIYDTFGLDQTQFDFDYESYDKDGNGFAVVNLNLRFALVPDVDRLSLGLVLNSPVSNSEGNQIIISNLQLEEVGSNDLTPSVFKKYASENLIYLKKAPDYYQCYQNWASYNKSQCEELLGVWDDLNKQCLPSMVCRKFAPYCSIEEVGCDKFVNKRTGENYNMVVSTEDYCPAVCSGYERLYENPTQFSDGRFVNMIASTAGVCNQAAVGCQVYTSVTEETNLESKNYFVYNRTCQLREAEDCQLFYTWDNPDGTDKTIKTYLLKAKDNEPVVLREDSSLCNQAIYNENTEPNCYKFYALRGGENIDLNNLNESNSYVSYHLIDSTITCSDNCRPYRLDYSVTRAQCLGEPGSVQSEMNKFTSFTNTPDSLGTCIVYAVLSENVATQVYNYNCSPVNVGCREYRGSRNHSYFQLLNENFELTSATRSWTGGARVKESVRKDGYSWQNLGTGTVEAVIPSAVVEGNLYLLTFWARSATVGTDSLVINLEGSTQYFTGDNAMVLDSNWQRYVLGPVQVAESLNNPILSFKGMNSGNLFIDNVELREVDDSYYFVADSWQTNTVCDQIPDTNIKVPGYMLGCDAYQDSYGYTHYLKSFSSPCRSDAVGCELVLDLNNNQEGMSVTYNKSLNLKEIGKLVVPVIENENDCLGDGYVWERGNCHYNVSYDSTDTVVRGRLVNQKQCELWGYYWLGTEESGKCVNDTIADDVLVANDKLIPMVVKQDYLCSAQFNGCSAFGRATTDAEDEPMSCALEQECKSAQGCACYDEDTNQYICSVPVGFYSCSFDTIYAINSPDQYEKTLCTANAKGCDKFTDSKNSIWYFRNPGNRVCEYKEERIEGQLKTGWFKKGTQEPCYPDYKPAFGLWGADQILDYYLAGVDDLQQYDNYVGSCSKVDDLCTRFIDPSAGSEGQRDYYYLDNSSIDTGSCNGQVNLAEGCVLLNNTSHSKLTYSAEKTYLENFKADYQAVAPQTGRDDASLNALTGYPNPNYLSTINLATLIGFSEVDLGNGIYQNYPYSITMVVDDEGNSSKVGLLDRIFGFSGERDQVNIVPGAGAGRDFSNIGNIYDLPIADGEAVANLPNNKWNDYASLYQSILSEMAKGGDENSFVNNTNVVVKVQRERVCAEWLSPADQEVVYSVGAKERNTTFNLVSCQKMSSGECIKLAPMTPPQYLEARLYALRGFGWNSIDYSGYSIPNRYSLADYKQLVLGDDEELVLALDLKKQCVNDSDCDIPGSKCIVGKCYNLKVGQAQGTSVECRAYPEASSPFIYRLGNPILENPQINRCYTMTGYCGDQLTGNVKDYKALCYSDLDCQPLQRCIFNNNSLVDNCDCDYTKLSYSDLGQSIYTDFDDEKLSSMGLCRGGSNDGLPCFSDNDCFSSQNRTSFRSELKAFQGANGIGTCIYPSSAEKKQGWKGFCLEKDLNQNCITWWPVNRLLGDDDIYYKDKKIGLPYLNRFYCLREDTLYKRLLVGAEPEGDVVCVSGAPSHNSSNFYKNILRASILNKTDIFFVSRSFEDAPEGYCKGNTPVVAMYPGAVVRVEGKNYSKGWNTEETDIGGNNDAQIIINGQAVLNYIKENWEGKSCFYMMVDLVGQYPNLFCHQEAGCFRSGFTGESLQSPLIIACASTDDLLGEVYEVAVPLSYNFADKINFIKDTYLNFNNRCVVGLIPTSNSGRIDRQVIHELFQRTCEYQNILQKDYPLAFMTYADYDSKYWTSSSSYGVDLSTRFDRGNVGGTEKVCGLMAEVRKEDGSHRAYTDNFSSGKNLSLLRLLGKDYNLDLENISIFNTGPTSSVGNNYQIPVQGSFASVSDKPEYIKALLSYNLGFFKILPIIVPRSLVKTTLSTATSPQPFGAISGNNLAQPYIVHKEGGVMISEYYLIGDSVDLLTKIKCNGTDAEFDPEEDDEPREDDCRSFWFKNRTTATLPNLDPESISGPSDEDNVPSEIFRKNLLFSLFNSFYSLKEYTVANSQERGKLSNIFSNQVVSGYQTVTDANYKLPQNTVMSEYCMYYDEDTQLYKDVIGYDSARLANGKLEDIIKRSSNNNGIYSRGLTCEGNYLVRTTMPTNSTISYDKIMLIKPPVIDFVYGETGSFVINVADNKYLSLEFYAYAHKNALPLRRLSIDWGEGQKTNYDGFIHNHQTECDEDSFHDKNLVELDKMIGFSDYQCEEVPLDCEFPPCGTITRCEFVGLDTTNITMDIDMTDRQLYNLRLQQAVLESKYDPSLYGSCTPVCINWPVGSSGKDIKGSICYDTDNEKLVKILRDSNVTIINNQIPELLRGEIYGHLYNQSLKCSLKYWTYKDDDLCIQVVNVVNGSNMETICESDPDNKVVFNALDFYDYNGSTFTQPTSTGTDARSRFYQGFTGVMGVTHWNPYRSSIGIKNLFTEFSSVLDEEKRMRTLYSQGSAGARNNCVDKPFSFKHWYQNIVSSDRKCNFGEPMKFASDGQTLIASTGDDVVYYCKLTGSVEVEDSMGGIKQSTFNVLVPTSNLFFRLRIERSVIGDDDESEWFDNFQIRYPSVKPALPSNNYDRFRIPQ